MMDIVVIIMCSGSQQVKFKYQYLPVACTYGDGQHLVDFGEFHKGDNFCDFLFCAHEDPPGSILKGKNLHPVGANSFLLD